jgi:hypothetical protein
VNADDTTLTSATVTIEKLLSVSEESGHSDEEADVEPQFPMLGEQFNCFEVTRIYFCSYVINDASLSRPEHLETQGSASKRDALY